MDLSNFGNVSLQGVDSPSFDDNLLPSVDQFSSSEFFFSDSGTLLRDVDVHVRLTSSPELQAKLNEFLIEQEVISFDSSISDDDVFKTLSSRYGSKYEALRAIDGRIAEIRAAANNSKSE